MASTTFEPPIRVLVCIAELKKKKATETVAAPKAAPNNKRKRSPAAKCASQKVCNTHSFQNKGRY
jgi:hypothetical protein